MDPMPTTIRSSFLPLVTLLLALGPALGCGSNDTSTLDASQQVDNPDTLGNDRPGSVHCGDDVCDFGIEADGVCCYEDDAQGQCLAQGDDCGGDQYGFGCDGPEDCEGGKSCCLSDQPRTGTCQAACTTDTLCHTHLDCLRFERCTPLPPSSLGYASCTSPDVRETPGFEGEGRVFCGDDVTACDKGDSCCVKGKLSTCRLECEDDEQARRCDGPEDCMAPELCAIEDGETRCIDATGMSTDGEPFVCHDSMDCSDYGCEPREGAPLLGFCNPNTGT
jgi:hypothetical protein